MSPSNIVICWSCKTENRLEGKANRNDHCQKCDQPLKCCYNCRFYDRDAHHQCLENQAEWVRYKEKANFCEFFTPRGLEVPVSKKNPEVKEAEAFSLSRQAKARTFTSKKDKDRAAWDSLFKD